MNFRQYKKDKTDIMNNKTYGVLFDSSNITTKEFITSDVNPTEDIVQNLFDGYLGEQREAPNPLEYGPNATYRNLREGIVYKKGPDNLWETFVKDGQNGKQGASGGSGTGVEEVKQISTYIATSIVTSALSGYSPSPSPQSSAIDSYIVTSGSVSGVAYYVTINSEIIVPSTSNNIDCSSGLNAIIVMAATSGYSIMLNDHYVENTVRFSTTNNIDVYCNGTITGPTSASKNMYVASSRINFYNMKLNYVHLFLESVCKDINFTNIIVNALSATPCIFFGATSTICPDHINITNAILTSGYAGLSIYGSTNCNFTNIVSKNCIRGYSIRGAHNCVWDNCASEGHPIVGFLNIPTTVTTPWNKGFVDNHFNNISVSGFSEEGFSFDINDGLIWNCKIVSATSAGIQFAEYTTNVSGASSALSEWYKYSLEFIDGKNAAKEYDIISANTTGFVYLNGFYDYSNCVSGDFAVVRVKCRGNTVTNLNVYSDTDSSSLVFWGFGNGTVVKNSNIYNGITTINGMSENNIFTNYCCPNNIVLENVKHVGKCTETYDTSNLKYSGISMLIYKYQYNYALSASNRTIIPEKTFLYNITIKDCEYITSNFRTCLNLYMTNNKGEITYQDCKDPQYVYPTFLNDTIYITSASQLSAFSGFYGQSLIDKSQTISNLPVEYSWSDTLNDWTINTPWSNILGPVFNTTYISGTPQTADLVISAGVSQRVAIPQGTHTKFKFTGYGPFRYRLGTSASVALSTDIYADPGDVIVNEKLTNTHLAVYGVSYGNVYVEGGSI